MSTEEPSAVRIIMPRYMLRFSCTGSACPDTCCAGFQQISIDRYTYQKYAQSADQASRTWLLNGLELSPQASTDRYAAVRMTADQRCYFLTAEGWCGLQQKFGADWLSCTCALYPRNTNLVGEAWEWSATFACPEVAQLGLLNAGALALQEVNLPEAQRPGIFKRLLAIPSATSEPIHYFPILRKTSMELLQNRKFTLPDRLILLGILMHDLDQLIANQKTAAIPERLAAQEQLWQSSQVLDKLQTLTAYPAFRFLVWQLFWPHICRVSMTKPYRELVGQVLQGLHYQEQAHSNDLAERYQELEKSFLDPFIIDHPQFLENYLLQRVYSSLFPFWGTGTLTDDAWMLAVLFTLLRIQLTGLGAYHGSLSTDLALTLIQQFCKNIEHDEERLHGFFRELDRLHQPGIGHLTTLLRS